MRARDVHVSFVSCYSRDHDFLLYYDEDVHADTNFFAHEPVVTELLEYGILKVSGVLSGCICSHEVTI